MSKLLDMLLRPEAADVQKHLPTADFEVKRLSAALGEPVVFHLTALPYGRVQELQDLEKDTSVHILLAGCPELKDGALQEKFGVPTPAEAVKALLLPGEIDDLSREVERLTGYRRTTLEQVKNA